MKKPKVKLKKAPIVCTCILCGREFVSKFEAKRYLCKGLNK